MRIGNKLLPTPLLTTIAKSFSRLTTPSYMGKNAWFVRIIHQQKICEIVYHEHDQLTQDLQLSFYPPYKTLVDVTAL